MKICILQDDFPPYSVGGAGMIAYNLAHGYHKNGHDVLVITTVKERHLVGRDISDGITIERIYSKYHECWQAYVSLYNPLVVSRVKQVLREWHPDIVHGHNVHGHLSYHSLKIASRSGARVVLTAHDAMLYHYGKAQDDTYVGALALLKVYRFRYNPFRNLIIRHYLQYVQNIVAVSDALRQALANNSIPRLSVIHNGIDAQAWRESPEAVATFKQTYGLGEHVVLFGGRLSGAKGGEKILEMLVRVSAEVPTVQLLVIGKKDAYALRMLAYAQRHSIADRIVFTGWITGDALRSAYVAAAVVTVPSIYPDPFPTVTLEAMASHKPVVATCLGGSREAVIDGTTGYVVDPSDVPVFAEKISELLRDIKKRNLYGETGYARVVREFSLTQQVLEYERLFIA